MKNRLAPLLLIFLAIALPAGCGDDDADDGGSDAPVAVNEPAEVPVDDADTDATEEPQNETVLLKLQELDRGTLSNEVPAIRGSAGLSIPDWMSTVDGDVATYWQSQLDRKSTRLNSSHAQYLVCRLLLEKKHN